MERYNRHFNGIFTSSHPPLPVFCKALAVECERLIVEKRNVEGSSDVRPYRSLINWPVIPRDYDTFDPFEAQYLSLAVSPAKATRSARKRLREVAHSQKKARKSAKKRWKRSCD